jgi:hypothetical protein
MEKTQRFGLSVIYGILNLNKIMSHRSKLNLSCKKHKFNLKPLTDSNTLVIIRLIKHKQHLRGKKI